MDDFVTYGNHRIDYTIKRKNRKTLGISVLPSGVVEISAPADACELKIKEVILKKGPWIINQKREVSSYPVVQPDRKLITGETVLFLGRQYRLNIIKSEETEVYIVDDKIFIESLDPYDYELNRKLLLSWYRSQASQIFEDRFLLCSKQMKRVGLEEKIQFSIRRMHKRWGSCSIDRGINLNLELVCTPTDCIDYVIFHELCHLKESAHNQRFYDLLATVCPDYRNLKKKLEMNSDGLMGL